MKFHDRHKEVYTFSMEWVPAEIQNLRLIAKVKAKRNPLRIIEKGIEDASGSLKKQTGFVFFITVHSGRLRFMMVPGLKPGILFRALPL